MANTLTRDDVIAISREEGLPPEFALNIWQQESGSKAKSKTSVDGAVGPFQVMPATFKSVFPDGNMSDPKDNARAGIRYLKEKYDVYGGDPKKVYASYHSGGAGLYTRSGKLKKDGLGKTTKSYVEDAMSRHAKLMKLVPASAPVDIEIASIPTASDPIDDDFAMDAASEGNETIIAASEPLMNPTGKKTKLAKFEDEIKIATPEIADNPYDMKGFDNVTKKILELIEQV